MPTAETYHLIAYDANSGEKVINWPIVVGEHPFTRGNIIEDQWRVIGVRDSSTSLLWEIDVQRLT